MADIPTPSSLADQEITSRIERQKIKWYEWLKEPLLYKVSESYKGTIQYNTIQYNVLYFERVDT